MCARRQHLIFHSSLMYLHISINITFFRNISHVQRAQQYAGVWCLRWSSHLKYRSNGRFDFCYKGFGSIEIFPLVKFHVEFSHISAALQQLVG